jgi:hypothetical protein
MGGKWLGKLKEIATSIVRVAVLRDPGTVAAIGTREAVDDESSRDWARGRSGQDVLTSRECAARLLSRTPESRGDFRLSKEKPRGEAGLEFIGPCGWREIRPRLQIEPAVMPCGNMNF